MENSNQYARYYKGLKKEELLEIISQQENYQNEARLAAYEELSLRGEEFSEEKNDEISVLKTEFAEEIVKKVDLEPEIEEMPEWYSPSAILGFTIFFSIIFGGVLMAINLRKENKIKQAVQAILVSLGVFVLGSLLYRYSNYNQWMVLMTNVVGGLLLLEFFWKKHLGASARFNKKPIWKILIISIIVFILFFAVMLKLNPELLQEIEKMRQ